MRSSNPQKGDVIILVLLLITIVSLILIPFFGVIAKELSVAKTRIDREEALQIAEAGVNYYQWHLALFPTRLSGRYRPRGAVRRAFYGPHTQKIIGYYSLTITPPSTGSTIVTIQSTGWTTDNTAVTRTGNGKIRYSITRDILVPQQWSDMDRQR